jgi:hypothetical protein
MTTSTTIPAALSADDINIDYAADDSCQLQCWTHGHVETETFLKACEQALESWDERKVSLSGKSVVHKTWLRFGLLESSRTAASVTLSMWSQNPAVALTL